jgi:glycosyltransferase involved in cell wall biosynthesis
MAALAHRSDVTLVETPPLSMAVSAFTSTSLGTPFVLSVSDVWPQSAVDIGALSNRRTIAFAERVERRVYERAVAVICLTRGIELHVSAIIGKERTYFIPNGIDPTLFGLAPQAPHRDRFLITYAGTIGLAQGLDNAVRAMASLKDKATLTIIGGGAARTSLEAQTAVEGASNVDFMPTLSRAEVIAQLQRSDAVLVSLRDTPMLRGAVPSKLYEAMASGRPVLLVAAGEAADLVRSVSCGIVVAPGDPVALSRAIISLSLDSGRDAMGERGRDFVFAHRDVNDLASQLEALLCRSAEQ